MCPIEARLLYIGTIVLADDDGKVRADPRYLKGQVFPYDENISSTDVEKWLESLRDIGQVLLYERDGLKVLKHQNWKKYQRIRDDMYVQSKLPNPLRGSNEDVTEELLNISKVNKDKLKQVKLADPQSAEIAEIIKLFENINPNYLEWYGNKTQRAAVKFLINGVGFEVLKSLVQKLPEITARKFAPKITTPFELKRDWAKLKLFIEQEKIRSSDRVIL